MEPAIISKLFFVPADVLLSNENFTYFLWFLKSVACLSP